MTLNESLRTSGGLFFVSRNDVFLVTSAFPLMQLVAEEKHETNVDRYSSIPSTDLLVCETWGRTSSTRLMQESRIRLTNGYGKQMIPDEDHMHLPTASKYKQQSFLDRSRHCPDSWCVCWNVAFRWCSQMCKFSQTLICHTRHFHQWRWLAVSKEMWEGAIIKRWETCEGCYSQVSLCLFSLAPKIEKQRT